MQSRILLTVSIAMMLALSSNTMAAEKDIRVPDISATLQAKIDNIMVESMARATPAVKLVVVDRQEKDQPKTRRKS